VLAALEAGGLGEPSKQRRLADGSVLAWVTPSRGVKYPMKKGMWVRLIPIVSLMNLREVGPVYRLATTLLNPCVAPAQCFSSSIMNVGGGTSDRRNQNHQRVQRRVLLQDSRRVFKRSMDISGTLRCACYDGSSRIEAMWTLTVSVLPGHCFNWLR